MTSGLSSSRTTSFPPQMSHTPSSFGGIELGVEDVALVLARAPASEPAHDLVVVDVDEDRRGQLAPEALHLLVERLGLAGGAREAVEDEAVLGLVALDALGDHADDHVVGDEVAAVHVLLRLAADLGLVAHGGAQDVAGRVVGQAEVGGEALALGPLARSGRAEQDRFSSDIPPPTGSVT